MRPSDVLLCVFSYNMGATLDNCLRYIAELAPGFDVVLMDDASTDPETLDVMNRHSRMFKDVFVNLDPKEGKRHGNLYRNIQHMCDYAAELGYRYVFLIQDDTQFVRPFSAAVLLEYQRIFEADAMLLQVDPRFLRFGRDFEVLREIGGYKNKGPTAYADVGIIDLQRLRASGWKLLEDERQNERGLAELGYKRVFPRTPVLMHVPFPPIYRKRKLKRPVLLWNRGRYGYHRMTDTQIAAMDSRDLEVLPFFRRYLTVRGMVLAKLVYHLRRDTRVFT